MHTVRDQLQSIPIARHDDRIPPLSLRLTREGPQDIVRFIAGQTHVHESEGRRQVREERPLLGQALRHGPSLGFVLVELLVTERLLLRVPRHHHH